MISGLTESFTARASSESGVPRPAPMRSARSADRSARSAGERRTWIGTVSDSSGARSVPAVWPP